MLEMQSDIVRQSTLSKASAEARETGVYLQESSLIDRTYALRNRVERPRSRLPWFTIILAASCIPALMMDGGISSLSSRGVSMTEQGAGTPPLSSSPIVAVADTSRLSPEEALAHQINSMAEDASQKAMVTVTVGGKSFSREISMDDLRAMQAQSGQ